MQTPPSFEFGTAGPYCQRWRERRFSFRHVSEGGFDRGRYEVRRIEEAPARAFVLQHHYSHSLPATRLRYGLFDRGREGSDGDCALVGVAILSVPVRAAVLTSIFPDLEAYRESLELGRFVLEDSVPANGESFTLARVMRLAAEDGIRGVVSFSDPMPRLSVDGEVILPGHCGVIYAASNATYTGRGRARWLTVLSDGTALNDRSAAKIVKGDVGHEHVEQRLVAMGARPPREREDRRRWLAAALDSVGARRVWHRGCHRYAFRVGESKRQRAAVSVALPPLPYPKVVDAAA